MKLFRVKISTTTLWHYLTPLGTSKNMQTIMTTRQMGGHDYNLSVTLYLKDLRAKPLISLESAIQ